MILVFWYGFSVPISGMCVIGVRSGQWCTRRCGFRTPCPRHRIETTPEQMKNIPQNFYGSLLRTIKVFADYSVSKLKQTLKKSSKAVVTSAWHLNWKQSRTCILVVSSWQSHLLVLFVLLFFLFTTVLILTIFSAVFWRINTATPTAGVQPKWL